MRRRMLAICCLVSLTGAAPAPPKRIVSLNTCSDQYVLALADPGQIAALSPYGHDPELSAAIGQARRFPVLKRPAEEVLALRPDLVIGFPDGAGGVVGAPDGRWRKLGLASADSFAAIRDQIRQVAAVVGHPARGEAMIAGMERDLAALPRSRRGGVAAYYQRRGYMTGTGTLVDELIRRAGSPSGCETWQASAGAGAAGGDDRGQARLSDCGARQRKGRRSGDGNAAPPGAAIHPPHPRTASVDRVRRPRLCAGRAQHRGAGGRRKQRQDAAKGRAPAMKRGGRPPPSPSTVRSGHARRHRPIGRRCCSHRRSHILHP